MNIGVVGAETHTAQLCEIVNLAAEDPRRSGKPRMRQDIARGAGGRGCRPHSPYRQKA